MANRTYMRIDGAEPLSGLVPLEFHIWGYLVGVNPDGSEGGISKPIKLFVDGYAVWSGNSGLWPYQPGGWIDLKPVLDKPGTHEIFIEFAGDAAWEACSTDVYQVVVSKRTTYIRVDGAEPLSGTVPLTFHLWGYLMGINPDGSHGTLGGKPIRFFVDGGIAWAGNTDIYGWIDLSGSLAAGTHEIYVQFLGDEVWEACNTDTYVVTVSKKNTYIRVDGATPLSGPFPLTLHIWGYLMGVKPDGSEVGLGGKPLRLIVNGASVWSGNSGSAPLQNDGWIDLYWTLSKAGNYEIYVEAVEDPEWLGCVSETYAVAVLMHTTTMLVRSSQAQKGGIWFEGELQDPTAFLNGKEIELYVDGKLETSCITGKKFLTPVTWLDGHWEFSYELPVGTYKVYARFPGDSDYEASLTSEYTIEVTEAKKFDPLEAIWAALRDAAKKVGLPAPPKPPSFPIPLPGV